MAVCYLDASALVKLILSEPHSLTLRAYLVDADLVSCELALTEVPRAARRFSARMHEPLEPLLEATAELLGRVALLPLDETLLEAAGALSEPFPRALDAIHVVAALELAPLDAFVSYDERQSAAARLAGLRTIAPGT